LALVLLSWWCLGEHIGNDTDGLPLPPGVLPLEAMTIERQNCRNLLFDKELLILRVRKDECREMEQLASGHTATYW
jgi:hypothetical protein